MLTHRLLKILNLSIAVLLVVFLIAAWWFAWRALPKTSGTIRAPIAAQANIARDRFGVPHIFAASWQDAVFLQGYATAQDRMWQMDVLRRLAAGEVSEVIGKAALENDQEARRLRLRRIAEAAAARLSPQDYAVLAAYARGINYYLETNQGKYGLEFAILRYDPRPWSPVDSILVGLQMYRTLTTSWKEEVQKSQLLSAPGADRAKVDALFPPRSGAEVQPGSNAWAVSGAWTSSGKPLLANDPHLEFSIPSIWYQVHLHAPGLNVIGVALPGIPCVIIGHNERIAWGVTNLQFDVQDLYREQLDPRTGQYAFRGTVERARLEPEVIAIKDEKPVSMPVWVTRHGPVVANEGNNYYALRWAAAEPDYQFPFLDLNRASNWQEFTAALARYPGPGQNFAYADIDGNIGYHATGRLPVRKAQAGDVPVDGSTGEFEWEGFIPFDQLPTAFNPASGLIVTANQNPFPPGYAFQVNGDFAAPYRSNQIRAMLQARKGWKPVDMITVQKDVYSGLQHFLATQIVGAYDRGKGIHPEWKDAIDLLRGWNGQMDKDSAAPMLAATTYAQLKSMVADRAAPGRGAEYNYPMGAPVIEQLLRQRPRSWFADWDKVLLDAFGKGIDDGAKLQGSNVKGWRYGKWNELELQHPVGGKIPSIGRYFNIGPIWMSGSPTSVKQTTRRLGPSMRFVADLSDWEQSLNNITTGESGRFLSGHYKDQWDTYYYAGHLPMQFGRIQAKGSVTVEPGR